MRGQADEARSWAEKENRYNRANLDALVGPQLEAYARGMTKLLATLNAHGDWRAEARALGEMRGHIAALIGGVAPADPLVVVGTPYVTSVIAITPAPSPTPSPAPTPFLPNAVREVGTVYAGKNFAGNLEPYTLLFRGPASLDVADLDYIGFIQWDVVLTATAKANVECTFQAWQDEQVFHPVTHAGSWVEEARWTLAPAQGEFKTIREPKLIFLGLGRRLHVRSDCRDWTVSIVGVYLGAGKVPGAPASWNGLDDLDCVDFGFSSTKATLFLSYFGEPGRYLYSLDGDGDGIACE